MVDVGIQTKPQKSFCGEHKEPWKNSSGTSTSNKSGIDLQELDENVTGELSSTGEFNFLISSNENSAELVDSSRETENIFIHESEKSGKKDILRLEVQNDGYSPELHQVYSPDDEKVIYRSEETSSTNSVSSGEEDNIDLDIKSKFKPPKDEVALLRERHFRPIHSPSFHIFKRNDKSSDRDMLESPIFTKLKAKSINSLDAADSHQKRESVREKPNVDRERTSTKCPFDSLKSETPVVSIVSSKEEDLLEKPKTKFHFAPDVVIGPAKPKPKKRTIYKKPMRLLEIKIAKGEIHKSKEPMVDKGVQTAEYIPSWKKPPRKILKSSEYKHSIKKKVKKAAKASDIPSEAILEEDEIIHSAYGPPLLSANQDEGGYKIDPQESESMKRLHEVESDIWRKHDSIKSEPSKTEVVKLSFKNTSIKRPMVKQPSSTQLFYPERESVLYSEMLNFFTNLDHKERTTFEQAFKGWEYAGYDWKKIKEVTYDPNPQRWSEMYDNIREDEFFSQNYKPHRLNDFMPDSVERGKFGLGKRCASLPQGTTELYRDLFQADPSMASIEQVLDALFRDRLFGLPIVINDPEEMRRLYNSIIVKDPKLFRSIMKNRDCLQNDLLEMVHNVLKCVDITSSALGDIYPSQKLSEAIKEAANKLYGSKISLEGRFSEHKDSHEKRPHELFFERHFNPEGSEVRYRPSELLIIEAAKVVDLDKEMRIKVHNPARNIIEEARYLSKEFALYVHPLFESSWRDICHDKSCEIMLPELRQLRDLKHSRLNRGEKVYCYNEEHNNKLCKELVTRLCKMLSSSSEVCNFNGVWKCLLACIDEITFYQSLGDYLAEEFDSWMPTLLFGLINEDKLVRQEVCFILALLVSEYHFISKLQIVSKNRLISNIAFAVLDAIELYPETYYFYYGVLAYLLHSVPSSSTLHAILTWIPDVMDRGDQSDLARDWPLFVYFVAKHWPKSVIKWRYDHEENILGLLDRAFLRPISKRHAQMALRYVCRRETCLPKLFTVWRGRKIGERMRIID